MRLASIQVAGEELVAFEAPHERLVPVRVALAAVAPRSPVPLDMLGIINADPPLRECLQRAWQAACDTGKPLPDVDRGMVRWHAPVRAPSKVVCLALNNRALDAIKIRAPTDHPAFFLKPSTAVTGHLEPIMLRECYGLTHPEPELGVVIGRRLRDAPPQSTLDAVFGYTIVNDITSVGMREEDSFSVRIFKPDPAAAGGVRVAEAHTSYPGRYKASDSFAPMGPVLVTADEIPDPAALRIQCWLGSRLVASDHTRNYVWSVANALSHISRTMTLLPGDVVSMGTAVGGDEDDPAAPAVPGVTRANLQGPEGQVTVTIERLGTLVNPVKRI